MDYTNEVFAVIAEEISKCKDGIITRAFVRQITGLLQKKRHYTNMQ
jgi:hypothetical protein